MADTTRQQIVDALIARLETILGNKDGGGFVTFAGGNVSLWKVVDVEQTKLPALVVRDTTDLIDREGVATAGDHTLTVEIDGLCEASKTETADKVARKLMADILKAIGVDESFGGLAYRTRLAQANMQVVKESKHFGGVDLALTINYRTGKWEI